MRRSGFPVKTLAGFVLSLVAFQSMAEDATGHSPTVVAELKLDIRERIPYIPFKLGDDSFLLAFTLLDYSIFDQSLEDKLSLQLVPTQAPPQTASPVKAPDLSIEGFKLLGSGKAYRTSLDWWRSSLRIDARGSLGNGYFRNYIVQVDYDRTRLRLLKPQAAPDTDWGQEFDLRPANDKSGAMTIDVRLPRFDPPFDKARFSLDITNNSAMLTQELFEVACRAQNGPVANMRFSYPGESSTMQAMRGPALQVGKYTYDDLITVGLDYNKLGGDFLSRHLVTIDYLNSKLYLRKREGYEARDEIDMSGLYLAWTGERHVVEEITDWSPAWNVGLQLGDEIVRVGGRDAQDLDTWQIEEMLKSGDGKRIDLTYRRGGELKKVVIVLKRRI